MELCHTRTKDDTSDTGPVDGAGAHRAWFGARVQRGGCENLGSEAARRFADNVQLSMAGDIILGDIGILSPQEQVASRIHQQRSTRHVAAVVRPARQIKGGSQPVQISISHSCTSTR
jgi:hypothetical protein